MQTEQDRRDACRCAAGYEGREIAAGALTLTPRPVALRDVEQARQPPALPGERTVIVPQL